VEAEREGQKLSIREESVLSLSLWLLFSVAIRPVVTGSQRL